MLTPVILKKEKKEIYHVTSFMHTEIDYGIGI